jgi:hypothetical protein
MIPNHDVGDSVMIGRLVALAALGATGVGIAQAQKRAAEAPTATFHFTKGYERAELLGGSSQMFVLQPVIGVCRKLKYITGINWSDKKHKSRPVPAGASINLFAQTKINSAGGGWMGAQSNLCAASVTFTPQPGANYSVIQRAIRPVSCNIEIVDRATGAPPPDLVVNTVKVCGGYM